MSVIPTIEPILNNIKYRVPKNRKTKYTQSIQFYGLDTEAYINGKMFMIATSEGDIFTPKDTPNFFFGRKYRNANFVVYNLKYDSGALLQWLNIKKLKELQETDETTYKGIKVKVIANKMLSFTKSGHTVHIYDIAGFFGTSLNKAAKTFLNKEKIDIETKDFKPSYVRKNWNTIAEYCIQDAVLTYELAKNLISKFESFGVYPQKLFSTAYISWQYFRQNCPYINVKRFYDSYPKVLDFAMRAYRGGKFEITEKGKDYLYEYDIVSAYPYEISNLLDIRRARVVFDKTYRKNAAYGFLKCYIKIPYGVYSPVSLKYKQLAIYPNGEFEATITKNEYDFLIRHKADITIIEGVWLYVNKKEYPYKKEINNLLKYKTKFKKEGKLIDYHIIKIFLNSLYGKFIQLIPKESYYQAGAGWNPVYASVITANTRIRISEWQNINPNIIAVHTDSIISKKPIQVDSKNKLGNMIYETEGDGVILGAGLYQVGNKSKFRGFDTKEKLIDKLPKKGKTLNIRTVEPVSWRLVAFRGLPYDRINLFERTEKRLNLRFDKKRIWIDDYSDFAQVHHRKVFSEPFIVNKLNIKGNKIISL